MKYIDNNSNITFNNVSEIGQMFGSVPLSKINNYTLNVNGDETEITAINQKVFNAIDIDWNGAEFENAINAQTILDENTVQSETPTITSTGDLIKILAKQQKQIDALIVMVKGLYQGLLSE